MEKSITFLRLIVWVVLILTPALSPAQGDAPTGSKTINLEAGIIKGRRLRPKIFLEFESTSPPVSAVMFKRKDFLDFYKRDAKVRLKYVPERVR